jgi:phospholipase C
LFDDATLAPSILMVLFGAHLTYLPVRFQGDDILFEHIAPLEPDPHPRRNYAEAIGRTLVEEAVGHTRFVPMSLGDTWGADNLRAKIDHIVLVMMENRSYDHVLGYRSIAPADGAEQGDGWTPDLMNVVATAVTPPGSTPDPNGQPPVGPLRNSAFALNAVNLRTQIPKSVGHKLANVRTQLAGQIDGPDGRRIIDPNGFVNDFRKNYLGDKPEGDAGVVPFDILRYYEKDAAVTDPNTGKPVDDLPMYGFLAEHYGYCDRYFSSHAGPTLPNRMYSLSGDTQYDRLGVPLLDNNFGENFQLSRAQTICDVLTRHGVSWRVYESFPSVTMLRMFARYATDTEHIGRLEDFIADAAAGNLPSFAMVEPAMHTHPENDDHPHADMYRGQAFIRTVYEALRTSPSWARTLLLITYDEHGGFYDHVIPPIADVIEPLLLPVVTADMLTEGDSGGGSGSPSGPHGHGLVIRPELLGLLMGEVVVTDAEPRDQTIRIPYGVRVPTFVVSPWVAPGRGPTLTVDHCSILKTVLARFCPDSRPFLSGRVHASHSFESFLTETAPRLDVGVPPAVEDLPITAPWRLSPASRITTPALYRKRLRNEQVDYQEISGRLARMLGR